MRRKLFLALGVLLAYASSAEAIVRIVKKNGKTIIYNDGIGERARAALSWSDDWLTLRAAIPSLYDELIAEEASFNSLDPKLVKAVMLVESAFNPYAVSPKGARGLMQLMPTTAAQHGVQNVYDPRENIAGGARHLSRLLSLYGGSLEKSLAAYNAGEEAVARYGGIPPYEETRLYIRKALTAYYGKPYLTGGFGQPAGLPGSWSLKRGRPVRLVRDSKNRVLLTTRPAPRTSSRPMT